MKPMDWIIAPLALICFTLSLAVIPYFVPLPDLIVVCLIAVVMCGYDFYLMVSRNSGDNGRSPRS